jgi:thioredoxin 1
MARLIKFQAGWCSPCKQLTKTMDEMDIKIPISYVDIDSQTDVAVTYGVRSIPTMIILDEYENVISKLMGNHTKEAITEFLGEYA